MRKQQGFGVTEYLLGAFVLTGIFFLPYKDNKSIVTILIEAVKQEHAGYMYAQSLSQFQVTHIKIKQQSNTKKPLHPVPFELKKYNE
ncbi:hypothetical protein [Shewanella woodyi]|uniref:hypothetical protein n=1 Tax=Shewanella woodyi TaxID=60961 RepID=UPI0007F8A21B|nr:hypothetical protein [Shewanella woodyi]